MLRMKLPFAVAGVLVASITLAGCSTPSEPVQEESVTAPSETSSTESTPGAESTTPIVDDSESYVVDVTTLGEGTQVGYPVNSLVTVATEDPTQWTLMSTDNSIVQVEAVPADNAATYNLGFRVLSAGTTEVALYNASSGENIKMTVTGS